MRTMTPTPYRFQDVFPPVHKAFMDAGWRSLTYKKKDDGGWALKGKDSSGSVVLIDLPLGTKPGSHIGDSDLLSMMDTYGVAPAPFSASDFVADYAEAWGFYRSEKKDFLLEMRHPDAENRVLYFNMIASGPNDVLLFVETDGHRVKEVLLKEIKNTFKLGLYLTTHGWMTRG